MAQSAELLRSAFESWNRDDLAGWLAFAAPDVEFHPAGAFPDFDRVFSGHDGLTRFWEAIHEPWDELRADVEDIDERGRDAVISIRFRARGHSGAEVDLRLATAVKFEDGLATMLISRATAQEAWQALAELEQRP